MDLNRLETELAVASKRVEDKSSLHFTVAVDGSEQAFQAYLTAVQLVRKGLDYLEVLHCFNLATVHFKPPNLQPLAIKERYLADLEARRLPRSKYTLSWLDKGSQPTRSYLVEYINRRSHTVDFFVVGVLGSVGVGPASPDARVRVMGSVSDLATRAVAVPTVLVKTAIPLGEGGGDRPRVHVVAVDETERSFTAYRVALQLIRPKDQVVVVHIFTPPTVMLEAVGEGEEQQQTSISSSSHDDDAAAGAAGASSLLVLELERRYREDMKERGLVEDKCDFMSVSKEVGVPLHEQVLSVCSKLRADFLILAPRVKETISSMCSHAILGGSKALNIVVVKS